MGTTKYSVYWKGFPCQAISDRVSLPNSLRERSSAISTFLSIKKTRLARLQPQPCNDKYGTTPLT
jgi:hypothetical protein